MLNMTLHEEYIKKLGQHIKKLRKEKSMTQLDVAIESEMEENAFQRIESGRTNPSTKTLLKIAKALDISMSEMFDFPTLNPIKKDREGKNKSKVTFKAKGLPPMSLSQRPDET